jgi:hypothetical protein
MWEFWNKLKLDPMSDAGGGAGGTPNAQGQAAGEQGGATGVSQSGADRGIAFNPSDDPSGQGNQGGAGVQGQGGGSSGVASIGGAGAGAGGMDDWEGVIDFARGMGYDFGGQEPQDERQFLLNLLNTATQNRQADYYAQLGRQIAPHFQGVQNYLQQQQAPAQQQQRPEWEPPEFDQEWLKLVDRDPQSGVFLAKPGVSPEVATAVNRYDRWYQKYGHNPVAAVRPFVEQSLPTMIRQVLQTEMQGYRQQQEIESIVSANAEWMYQQDQHGRPVLGVGNRPVATAEGARYAQIVGELESAGMRNPSAVDRMAKQILMGELAQAQLRSGQQQPPAQQQRNALASGRSQRNVLQSLAPQQRQQTAGATQPDRSGLSLAEQMRLDLDQAGFTDSDFMSPEDLVR